MPAFDGYAYDVCLSFAGEQRAYVERVAGCLKQARVGVFYDDYETVNLWGEDLVQHLDKVFREQARFCVMFVSADYARKIWTTHELRSIQARVLRSATAYLLPVRFDETEIPGLLESIGVLNAMDFEPEQIAELVIAKLSTVPNPSVRGTSENNTRVVTSQLFGLTQVVGRSALLKELSDGLRGEGQRRSRQPAIRVITGIGGIGKSSVARAYATEHQSLYDLIWWVRAEENLLVVEDFRGLLVALGVPDVQRIEQPVQHAHVMLANRQRRWLLVFDNVPEQASLRGLVPPDGGGDVIVTSRSTSWGNPRVIIAVPPLDEDGGSALLREVSGEHDDAAGRELVSELGGLPLALHQAGSYVAENPIGLPEYLTLYRRHRSRLHYLGSAPDYDLRVGTVWEVSFRMLPETAQTMVNVLAWLAPEEIPLDLLLRQAAVDGVPDTLVSRVDAVFTSEIDYFNAVSALSAYGLVSLNDRDANVHRLIQAVTRDNAHSAGDADEWATAAAAILLAGVPTPPANAQRISAWCGSIRTFSTFSVLHPLRRAGRAFACAIGQPSGRVR